MAKKIALLIVCQSLAGVAVQSLMGHFIDESHQKKLLTGVAAIVASLCAVGIAVRASREAASGGDGAV